jgi:hypothetical protein
MNSQVRILNELWVRFAEVRILKDLASWDGPDARPWSLDPWQPPIEGVAGRAVCKWMKA